MTLVDTRPSVTDTAAALYVVAGNAHRLAAEEVIEGSGVPKLKVLLDALLPNTGPVTAGLWVLAIGDNHDRAEDIMRLSIAEVTETYPAQIGGLDPVRTWHAFHQEAQIQRGQAMATAIDAVRADRQLP